MLTLEDIGLLFARHGSAQYSGEPVDPARARAADRPASPTQSERRATRSSPPALLRDLGHLLNRARSRRPPCAGIDEHSTSIYRPALPARPVPRRAGARRRSSWHVDAKRYLCADRQRATAAGLSADSRRSLGPAGRRLLARRGSASIAQPRARRRGAAAPVGRPRQCQAGRSAHAAARPLHRSRRGARARAGRSHHAAMTLGAQLERQSRRSSSASLLHAARNAARQVRPRQGARHRADPAVLGCGVGAALAARPSRLPAARRAWPA